MQIAEIKREDIKIEFMKTFRPLRRDLKTIFCIPIYSRNAKLNLKNIKGIFFDKKK